MSSYDTSEVPRDLTFQQLKDITDGFSEENKIGSGGYGDVYKGILDDGEVIAVKKLNNTITIDDQQFMQEFDNLIRVRHQNIIRLVGYCYETKHIYIEVNGAYKFASVAGRALCFEYLKHGSLDKHLSDESCGLDWCKRYKIIKGICEGLHYLHEGLNKPIFHLDLKPSNVLLDDDMAPKIADFGLSRFLIETKSHILTETFGGTIDYMPPEYITRREISNKFDVFSLGIIIIQIITGPEGYTTKYLKNSPEKFVELVRNNWMNRIHETSMYAEECCEQVRRCIEIAQMCLEVERTERPTIGNIIKKLMQIEIINPEVSIPFSESLSLGEGGEEEKVHVLLATFGPWGANAGKTHNIKVAPHHLESVTIWSADIVDALAFSYSERNGRKHSIGTWGGPGGFTDMIQFGPFEFLVEISGTTGPYVCTENDVVKSLMFVTNVRSYGPYGSGGGTPFSTSVQANGSIVGFFGRSGLFLNAIGVYVNPNRLALAELEPVEDVDREAEDAVTKIGLWGGNGGIPYDMEVVPHRLESMTIYSDVVIRSLEFLYTDVKGHTHSAGRWGGPGGRADTIRLGRFNHIRGISGTFDLFDKSPSSVMTSLTISTVIDSKIYGPFGQGGGTQFTVPVETNGSVVGFFGRAGSYLDALGVYIRKY